jgi:hypothetical protein
MGETFVTVPHAQAWSLICTYEARKTYFTRAWMSTGRVVRLCQMLGLHRLDGNPALQDAKQILPLPKDWIELEERRRTFWAAFYGDRWASSGTGWPMNMDEKLVRRISLQKDLRLHSYRSQHIFQLPKRPMSKEIWKRQYLSMMH